MFELWDHVSANACEVCVAQGERGLQSSTEKSPGGKMSLLKHVYAQCTRKV